MLVGDVGDCEGQTEAGADAAMQTNTPWGYKPGTRNLFEAMAKRTDEALRDAPPGSELVGVLWYQVTPEHAAFLVGILNALEIRMCLRCGVSRVDDHGEGGGLS